MTTGTTLRMIELYRDQAPAPLFLQGFFQSPARNFHASEDVTIDIERDDEDVAIVITSLKAGPRQNEASQFTNKRFTPPIFDEEAAIASFDQIVRRPGVDPFQDPDYMANAAEEAFGVFNKLTRKIRRSIELMASQVLQTGTLTLRDQAGVALYTLDFAHRSAHRPNASVNWGTVVSDARTDVPLTDLANLANLIRRNGKSRPSRLIFGERAWSDFSSHPQVQALLDRRNIMVGEIAPQLVGADGAVFQGYIWIGQYRYELWTYDGYYRDPQTGNHTAYVGTDKVIMLSEGTRLDLTWGAIPMLRQPTAPAMQFLPPRMSSSRGLFDFTTNAYFSPDGKRLMVGAGTRPLTIPTAIDTFGCLTTRV